VGVTAQFKMDGVAGHEAGPVAPQTPLDEAAMIDEVEAVGLRLEQEPTSIIESGQEPSQAGEPRMIPDVAGEVRHPLSNSILRPILRRNDSAPSQQYAQPTNPAPLPPNALGLPTDSLSLTQLRNLVREMPRLDRPSYAFVYKNASSFPDELEEWFFYNAEDQNILRDVKKTFVHEWVQYNGLRQDDGSAYLKGDIDWTKVDGADRERFVQDAVAAIGVEVSPTQCKSLEMLVYIALGCWHETAGLEGTDRSFASASDESSEAPQLSSSAFDKSSVQIEWIKRNVQLICNSGGLQPIYDVYRSSCIREWCVPFVLVPSVKRIHVKLIRRSDMALSGQDIKNDVRNMQRRVLWCAMTLIYVILEVERELESKESPQYRATICKSFLGHKCYC